MSAEQRLEKGKIENCKRQTFYGAVKKRPLSPQGSLVFQELQEELDVRTPWKKECLFLEECELIDTESNATMTSLGCPFDIDNSNDMILQRKNRRHSSSSSSSSSSSDSSFMFEARFIMTASNGGHRHHKQPTVNQINVKYAYGDQYWHQPSLLRSGFPVNLTSDPSVILHEIRRDDIHTFVFESDGIRFYVEAPDVADKELSLTDSTSEFDDPTSDRRCFKLVMDPLSDDKFLLQPVGGENICVGFGRVDTGGGREDYVIKTVKIDSHSPKWTFQQL